jgi:hypothetical protein
MTKELAIEMECNLYNPMKMLQEICGSNFWKQIGKGTLGRQKDEMRRIGGMLKK